MYIKTKDRPCKACGKNKRIQGLSICYQCKREKDVIRFFAQREKARKKEMTDKFRAMKDRIKNSIPELKKTAWKLMSKWIRIKDADADGNVRCYTCGNVKHWKECDAGHFIHSKLSYDERNIHVQCVYCNQYLSGNLSKYRDHLLRDHGQDWLDKLEADAVPHKYTQNELKEIIENLKNKLIDYGF